MAVTLRNNISINGGLHVDTWSPQLLFPAATQDVWYDPSDINLTWRRNLLTYTEQFDNASVWLKLGGSGSSVAGNVTATAAPDGTFTADKFSVGTGSSSWYVAWYGGSLPLVAGRAQTFSIYVKAAGHNFVFLRAHNNTAAISASGFIVNLLTGAITYPATPTLPLSTGTATNVGDGWWRVTVTSIANLTTHIGSGGPGIWPIPTASFVNDAGPGPANFTGDGTSGVYLWGAQFEVGSTATPYQRITDGVVDYLNYSASLPIMFQDYQGTLITSQVEQPVGLMLDKSQGLAQGSERVTNGTFDTNLADWAIDNASGTARQVTWTASGARIQNDGSGNITFRQNSVFEASKSYRVTFTAVVTAGSIDFQRGSTTIANISASGSYSYFVTASVLERIAFARSLLCDVTIDNISVRELPGNHASQSTPNSRPYLRARHNLLTYSEEFDNAAWIKTNSFIQTNLLTYSEQFDNPAWSKTNSTVTANAGIAPDGTTTADKITPNAGGVTPYLYQTLTTTVAPYSVSFYAKANGYNFVQISDGVSATDYCNFNLSTGAVGNFVGYTGSIQDAGSGWYRCIVTKTFTAASTEIRIEPLSTDAASRRPSFVADGTSAILLWGAQLVQGAAPGNYQVTTSAATVQYLAPNGTLTARSLIENSTTGEHRIVQATASAVTVGGRYTYSFYVKANGRSSLRIYSFAFNNYIPIINFETNTVFSSAGGTSPTISSVSVGNGWYRVAFSDIATAANFDALVMLVSGTSTFNYAGDNTSGVYLWGAMLNYGSSAGTYQRTAASSYSTVGTLDYDPVGQKTYLWFDGIDDGLVTNSINFSGTNKMFVCAGVTKFANVFSPIAELSATVSTNPGAMLLFVNSGDAYGYVTSGTIAPTAVLSSGDASPVTSVLSGQSSISTPLMTFRKNSAAVGSSSATQGTGNFGNYPLYVGRRNNSINPFNGLLYNLMIIGAQVDPVNIQKAERFVADKTGITI